MRIHITYKRKRRQYVRLLSSKSVFQISFVMLVVSSKNKYDNMKYNLIGSFLNFFISIHPFCAIIPHDIIVNIESHL